MPRPKNWSNRHQTLDFVTPTGFEPVTNCLRGNCSAVELRSQLDVNLMRTEIIPEGEYMSISVGTYLFAGEHGIDEK